MNLLLKLALVVSLSSSMALAENVGRLELLDGRSLIVDDFGGFEKLNWNQVNNYMPSNHTLFVFLAEHHPFWSRRKQPVFVPVQDVIEVKRLPNRRNNVNLRKDPASFDFQVKTREGKEFLFDMQLRTMVFDPGTKERAENIKSGTDLRGVLPVMHRDPVSGQSTQSYVRTSNIADYRVIPSDQLEAAIAESRELNAKYLANKQIEEKQQAEREEKERHLAAERRERALEKERQEKLAQAELEKHKLKAAELFRQQAQPGDESHCGLIIEMKRPIAKVQLAQGEVWMKVSQLYPVGEATCHFVNGRYMEP